ncbi:MAG: hypothetical protein ACREFK_02980 [Stellaceae bacterium]
MNDDARDRIAPPIVARGKPQNRIVDRPDVGVAWVIFRRFHDREAVAFAGREHLRRGGAGTGLQICQSAYAFHADVYAFSLPALALQGL